MARILQPFWIYWGALVLGCILFLMCPIVLFIFLPMLVFAVPVWFIVVCWIGNAVQKRSGWKKISRRIALAFVCTGLSVLVYPVCIWLYDVVKWNSLQWDSLLHQVKDPVFRIGSAIHFLAFWIGEEAEHMFGEKEQAKGDQRDEN